jgi:zinc and cadmium transporter
MESMHLALAALAATIAIQVVAVVSAWGLRAQESLLHRRLPFIVSLAVGVLLATALLHLMPESIARLGNGALPWALALAAMLVLFAIERIFFALTGSHAEPEVVPTHEHHHHHHAHSTRPFNLLLASMLHSFVDGAAVAAAFLVGPHIGWLTALAIALHEIPHRMGDFAVFVHLKLTPRRALNMAVLAGLPSLLGVLAVAAIGTARTHNVALLLPLSAGSFLYIATANLLPELQEECRWTRVAGQIACLAAGVLLVVLVGGLAPE